MSEEVDTEFDGEADQPVDQAQGFISPFACFKQYSKGREWLVAEAKAGRIKKRSVNGQIVYSEADIRTVLGATSDPVMNGGPRPAEMAAGDLVRAAASMMSQIQAHHEKMFNAYEGAHEKLFKILERSVERQNDQVMKLEDQSLKMRELAEAAISQEQARKLEATQVEHKQKIQEQALKTLAMTVGPWVQQKLSHSMGAAPAAPAAPGAAPAPAPVDEGQARLAMLGQAIVGTIASMSDEKFAALRPLVGEDEHDMLMMVREQIKAAQGAT